MKKALLALLCVIAIVVTTVFGTLAYLTDKDADTNTFTVGNVKIELDELDVDNSTEGENDRDKANEYHLLPGMTYVKDPTVHVDPISESSWIFIQVENGLADIEAAVDELGTITEQILANKWTELTGVDGVNNVYYKQWDAPAEGATIPEGYYDLVVFEKFKIDGETVVNVPDGEDVPTDKFDIAVYDDAQIVITAYAIQLAGFEGNPAAAWLAGQGQW